MRIPSTVVVVLGLAAFALPQTPASLLQEGARALGAGHAREALRLGEAFVARFPKRYEGYRLVGRASMPLDDPTRAEKAFRRSQKLAPVAVRASIGAEIAGAVALEKALVERARAEKLKAFGDLVGAARAAEAAFGAYDARAAYGFDAAERYEAAGKFDDARRLLAEIGRRHPKASVAEKLAALDARAETARAQSAADEALREEKERKDAEAKRAEAARRAEATRKAKEAQERETQRRADEERERIEKARQDQEEADRLRRVLAEDQAGAAQAERAVASADAAYADADRIVRSLDGDADDARAKRDRAKRKRDDLADKLRDAKGELARQVYQDDLRTAQRDYDEAKGDFDRIDRRLSDAKSQRDAAQSDGSNARSALERWRQAIRDTEAAITRLSGA